MLRFLFVFYLFWTTSTLSADNLFVIRITADSEPLATVGGCVNTLSGQFFLVEQDLISSRAGGLNYTRVYDSGSEVPNVLGYSWGGNFPKELYFIEYKKGESYVYTGQQEYSLFPFEIPKDKYEFKGTVYEKVYDVGYSNTVDSLLMGEPPFPLTTVFCDKTDNKHRKKPWTVTLPNGTVRTFVRIQKPAKYSNCKIYRYVISQEQLPNGLIRHYSYFPNSNIYQKIWVTDAANSRVLDTLEFDYGELARSLKLDNGRKVSYSLGKVPIEYTYPGKVVLGLKTSSGDHLPRTFYQQTLFNFGDYDHFKISKVNLPNERGVVIDYFEDPKKSNYAKVKELKVPKEKGGYTSLFQFKYLSNCTEVTDPFNNTTSYFKENRRLVKVQQGNYRSFQYQWDKKGKLLSRNLLGSQQEKIKSTTFSYDAFGNLTKKAETGKITGQSDHDQFVHTYRYDTENRHLKISEILPNGTEIHYTYKPGTNLVASQLTLSQGSIKERTFHTYDENALLVETIVDDGISIDSNSVEGVTYRLITETKINLDSDSSGYTLPESETEYAFDPCTGEKKLLRRKQLLYTLGDLVSEENIFDANNQYAFSLSYQYNKAGLPVVKTNALGEETHYQYDLNHHLIREEVIGEGKFTQYFYDRNNRLIKQNIVLDTGEELISTYTYDSFGNKLTETDLYGAVTAYTYDAYSRLIQTVDPLGNVTKTEYDFMDHPIKEIDQEGNITTKRFNIFGKPLEILYPDGNREIFSYDCSGNLIKKTDISGTRIHYLYDYQDRVLSEKTYDSCGNLLKELSYQYKGKNLISEIDNSGVATSYCYDSAGRLISKKRAEVEEIYGYDSLGRQRSTICADRMEIKEYDFLDRVTEIRIEDLQGSIYRKKKIAYDIGGNTISERVYNHEDEYSEIQIRYNGLNEITLSINPEGNETHYLYHRTDHLHTIKIDPMGQEEHTRFDRMQQIVKKEKFHSDLLLARETFQYNPCGHKIAQVHDVIVNGIVNGTYKAEWEYDSMGRVIKEIEQGDKITKTTYLFGRKDTVIKPDGVSLFHTYDGLGRLIKYRSSDQTIDYDYVYDSLDNVIGIEDRIHHHTLNREYDTHGQMIKETLPNGYTSTYTYDPLNRLTQMTLPDATMIHYDYNVADLIRVKRGESTHHYAYNLVGDVVQEVCLNGQEVNYLYDASRRLIQKDAPHYQQLLAYDPAGNITYSKVNQAEAYYHYDPLYQLVSEEGKFFHSYDYDSLNNRISMDDEEYVLNDLHQLLAVLEDQYTYDKNGNRLSKNSSSYTYDTLNRLCSIDDISYTYDPFGRMMSRNDEGYLYYKEFDMGNPDFLRIIGRGTIAIEKNGTLYSVITDHRGSVAVVMDSSGPVATYEYGAFGEVIQEGSFSSPWQFCSQRVDSETGLLHFLKRVYDPEIGRWLTPDPAGFADGPNLYAYVQNNPLRYIDPLGLSKEEQKIADRSFAYHFSRGFVDDTTMGVSSYFMGEHHAPTFSASTAYYAGMASSLACGLVYGGTYLKGAKVGGKVLAKGWNAGKYLFRGGKAANNTLKGRNVVKYTEDTFKAITNVSNKMMSPGTERLKCIDRSTSYFGSKRFPLNYAPYQRYRNPPSTINGRYYQGHAIDRMQDRGLVPSVIEETISNGIMKHNKVPGRVQYYDRKNKLRVITESNGDIVTIIPGRG